MTTVAAHEATQTHYCKFPGCGNEAASKYGRYAYCAEHQGRAAKKREGGKDTLAAQIAALSRQAREIDRLDAKAVALKEKAAEAAQKAEKARNELRESMRELVAT